MKTSSMLLVLIFISQSLAAQSVGFKTADLKTGPATEAVTVETESGAGMATVIELDDSITKEGYLGKAVTANHVVAEAKSIKIRFPNGQVAKNCTVIACDEDNDLALIWIWAPRGTAVTPVAETPISPGQSVRLIGKAARRMSGRASPPTNTEKIYLDLELNPGDSGGPVVNDAGELVGVVSGGWFWYDKSKTWPARTSNLQPIRKLLGRGNGRGIPIN